MADNPSDFIDPVEDFPWLSRRRIFARYGYERLPPAELTDTQLPGRLWEGLYAAAARRFIFLSSSYIWSPIPLARCSNWW